MVIEHFDPLTCPLRVSSGEAPAPPAPLATVATGTDLQYSARGDFDGNGHPDIALAKKGNSVSLLLNQGTRSFVLRDVRTDIHILRIVAEDFNGDGHDDLAAGSWVKGGGCFSSAANVFALRMASSARFAARAIFSSAAWSFFSSVASFSVASWHLFSAATTSA